jgi:L-asparaginase II
VQASEELSSYRQAPEGRDRRNGEFGFDDADIALMSASPSEPRHVTQAKEMIRNIGAKEEALACGGHPSILASINRTWIMEKLVLGKICNTCFGKHVVMMAGAVSLGALVQGYEKFERPLQIKVRKAVEDMSGLREEEESTTIILLNSCAASRRNGHNRALQGFRQVEISCFSVPSGT